MSKEVVKTGIVNIYSTFNNTIAQLTDLAGNTIAKISGGVITKQDRLKANPTIAMFIAKRLKEIARDYEITSLYVRVRGQTTSTGPGPGAHALVKTLSKEGFKIISIADITRVPRGGPKKGGGRRGRRV
jgi:small subunit ribosomal protein S11